MLTSVLDYLDPASREQTLRMCDQNGLKARPRSNSVGASRSLSSEIC
jgi:hypothetical protein